MNTSNNHYNKRLKSYAREHRNGSTKAEVRLWCELLRAKKMLGYSFLRQRPIDKYIADFFCQELKLIIETDGISHSWEETVSKDIRKTRDLENLGYAILRFEDEDIMKHLEFVQEAIEDWIKNHPPTPP